jgi:cytoskeletal protein RodZ
MFNSGTTAMSYIDNRRICNLLPKMRKWKDEELAKHLYSHIPEYVEAAKVVIDERKTGRPLRIQRVSVVFVLLGIVVNLAIGLTKCQTDKQTNQPQSTPSTALPAVSSKGPTLSAQEAPNDSKRKQPEKPDAPSPDARK